MIETKCEDCGNSLWNSDYSQIVVCNCKKQSKGDLQMKDTPMLERMLAVGEPNGNNPVDNFFRSLLPADSVARKPRKPLMEALNQMSREQD